MFTMCVYVVGKYSKVLRQIRHKIGHFGDVFLLRRLTAKMSIKYSIQYTNTAVHSLTCHTATGTHMPYRIIQCYLPPDRGDIPAFSPAEAGTRLSDPGGMQG